MHCTLVTVADLLPTCRPNNRSAAGRQQVGKWGRLGLSCAGIGEAIGEARLAASRGRAGSEPWSSWQRAVVELSPGAHQLTGVRAA